MIEFNAGLERELERELERPMAESVVLRLDDLTEEELDELPYGMIQLDTSGRVLRYNSTEARISTLDQKRQIGRHFFVDVAPCTRVKEFYGAFVSGVEARSLDVTFKYHFNFTHGPGDFMIRLFYSARTNTAWVLVADPDGRPLEIDK
jgi:photoactive yellow protein